MSPHLRWPWHLLIACGAQVDSVRLASVSSPVEQVLFTFTEFFLVGDRGHCRRIGGTVSGFMNMGRPVRRRSDRDP